MIPLTRPVAGSGRHHAGGHRYGSGASGVRPAGGGAARVTVPLPAAVGGTDMPFAGMDPSNPLTYVRPWNPQPGMVARLNFDGAQAQAYTDTAGVQGNPASWLTRAGARPARRPR